MNEFLELASYDWMLSEPQGKHIKIESRESVIVKSLTRIPTKTFIKIFLNPGSLSI